MIKQVLVGLMAAAVISVTPAIASAQDAADITLVHGVPGATVDVEVGGAVVIDDFVPGSLADISSFAGETLVNLTVIDSKTGDDLIGPVASFDVPATGSWSVVAHLDADGNAVLSSFENNIDEADGASRVTVRHTAQAPAVDLVIGDQRPIVGAINGDTAELELPAGQLTDAQVAPTGAAPIAQLATLNLAADTNTVIYVVGEAPDNLDFVVQVIDLPVAAAATTTTVAGATTTTTAAVPTAVNTGSPIDGSSSLTLIMVSLGALAIAGGALVARRRL